jgi:phage N-6-adenine-methyltransferase
MALDVHFSSKSDEWGTPRALFDKLNSVFRFTLDAAASHDNALCGLYYTQADDGLSMCWKQHVTWVNPPYSKLKDWLKKGAEEGKHTTVVMLVPARTDTRAWQDYVMPNATEIHYVRGRLKFGDSKNAAPFPSAIVVFSPRVADVL